MVTFSPLQKSVSAVLGSVVPPGRRRGLRYWWVWTHIQIIHIKAIIFGIVAELKYDESMSVYPAGGFDENRLGYSLHRDRYLQGF